MGERQTTELPVNSLVHPAGRPINTSTIEVSRPPVEPSQYTSLEFSNRLADWNVHASYGQTGCCYDCEKNGGVVGSGLTLATTGR